MAKRYDRLQLKFDATKVTSEGFLQTDGGVARVGVLVYKHEDGSETREAVHWRDLWDAKSIDTLRMLPVVNTHDGGMVTPENIKKRKIGHLGENARPDGDMVVVPIRIDSIDGLDAVDSGVVELSLGYECDVVEESGEIDGEAYDHRQVNRRYNHLALVPSARAGHDARLRFDGAVQINDHQTESRGNLMKKKIKFDAATLKAVPTLAKYDGADYEVDAYISLMIEDLVISFGDTSARMDAAEAKVAGGVEALRLANKRADEAEGKLATANETVTALKADAGDKTKIDAAVKDRVAIILSAEPHVDAETFKKFDGMTNREIMVAAAKTISPKFDDAGKSDDYVRSRFDSLVEAQGEIALGSQREVAHGGREDAAPAKSIEQLKAERASKLDSMRTDWRKSRQGK